MSATARRHRTQIDVQKTLHEKEVSGIQFRPCSLAAQKRRVEGRDPATRARLRRRLEGRRLSSTRTRGSFSATRYVFLGWRLTASIEVASLNGRDNDCKVPYKAVAFRCAYERLRSRSQRDLEDDLEESKGPP